MAFDDEGIILNLKGFTQDTSVLHCRYGNIMVIYGLVIGDKTQKIKNSLENSLTQFTKNENNV